jgi:glucosylceramidase
MSPTSIPFRGTPPDGPRPSRRRAIQAGMFALCLAAAGPFIAQAPAAFAAGEPVNIWLTTTSDSGGRTVTRGMQQQTPIAFAGSSGSANQTITVN